MDEANWIDRWAPRLVKFGISAMIVSIIGLFCCAVITSVGLALCFTSAGCP